MRRGVSLLSSFFQMGFMAAIARHVSLTDRSQAAARSPKSYLVAALLLLSVVAAPFVVLANIFPQEVAEFGLGDDRLAHLVPAMTILVLGGIWHCCAFAYLQGELQIQMANGLAFLNLVVFPVTVFFIWEDTISGLFFAQGCLVSGSSLLALIGIARSAGAFGRDSFLAHILSLWHYAVRRLPCDVGIAIVIGAPALIAAHLYGTEVGGGVAFGTTLLSLAGTAVAPIAMILMPESSRLLKEGGLPRIRAYLRRRIRVYMLMGVVGVGGGQLLLRPAVELYLGEEFMHLIPVLRIILVGALPYLFYCGLRSVVDAVSYRPINARDVWLGLIAGTFVLALARSMITGVNALLFALLATLFVLAALTLFEVHRISEGRLRLEQHEPN